MKIDYLAKSKKRTKRYNETLAKVELCKVQQGSRLLFHYVMTGCRKRAVHLAHFQSWPCFTGNAKLRLSTYQFNQMFLEHGSAAIRLLKLITGGKEKNKARTIANLAPICASYEFCPVH